MTVQCPHCKNDDKTMLAVIGKTSDGKDIFFCEVCSKAFTPVAGKAYA